jgi:hypothetical protein
MNLADTKIGQSVTEMIEDRFDDVVRHYQDVAATTKPSKITIELTVTPDERRQQYSFNVAAKTALSPRSTYSTSLYAAVNGDDQVEVVEYDPSQLTLFEKTPL